MPKSTSRLHDRPIGGPSAAAKAAGSYARFIPREEIGSFSAWTPGALGGAPGAANVPGMAPLDGHAEGQGAPRGADPQDAASVLAAARQSGYQDGYRDGLAALESFKQSFATQMSARVGTLLQGFDEQLLLLEQDMAAAIADTATQLARQVVRDELTRDPGCIARVAQEALTALMLSARHITIRVNPDDEALVSSGLDESLRARGARLIADATIQRGGCLMDSDIGAVDARIETRWERAVGALGADTPYDEKAGDA